MRKVVLCWAVVILVGMLLCPPWRSVYSPKPGYARSSYPEGYYWLWSPPEQFASIDLVRLGLQCGAIVLVTAATLFLLPTAGVPSSGEAAQAEAVCKPDWRPGPPVREPHSHGDFWKGAKMSKAQSMQDLGGFGRMAYRHWEKHRPTLFTHLKSNGTLFEHLKDAEDQAEAYMEEAERQKRDYYESLEIAKETWIILPDVESAESPTPRGETD